jgi:two-component system copper resistance phosphate regulon response regulator CusR
VIDKLNLDIRPNRGESDFTYAEEGKVKILLVGDEVHTAQYLQKGLVQNGFAVDVMGRETAAAVPRGTEYDLLVCDIATGGGHLPELRREKPFPVLFLADRRAPPELYEGDCLFKPFAFADFLARVRGLLCSTVNSSPLTFGIAGLELDLVRHRAARDGRRLDLTPKEFLLLSLLMRRCGEVLSRTVIADQVWEINFESNTNFVDVHIRRLRSKVDDPFPKKLIHTVRGIGYVLEER